MVDYSKWDHIDLSDDDSDCHPNIDKASWLRWKKQSKDLRREEAAAQRRAEDEERAQKAAAAESAQAKLREGVVVDEAEKEALQLEAERSQQRVRELEEKRRREEELQRKHPQWDDDSICHDGFSKTIVNNAKKQAEEEEKKAKEMLAKMSEEEKKRLEQDQEKKMDEYVNEMETKAHKFVACESFDQYEEVLTGYPEIVCGETHEYLLLHSSDCIKKGLDDMGRKYLRAASIVSYCLELGKQGVMLFFRRMNDPDPKYRREFEKDQEAYWQRCKEKILELQEQRKQRAAKGLPEDEEEDTSDKVD